MKVIWITTLMLGAFFIVGGPVGGMDDTTEKPMEKNTANLRYAVFAGGCFWCTEADFEKVDGVIEAVSGYTGGRLENPTYKQVSGGGTGHVEAIKVIYDPGKVAYEQLLEIFWRHVDPTDPGGQFVDRGDQYRSVIFYATDEERQLAEASKAALNESGPFERPVVTDILPLGHFYEAEAYHQDYYQKNPLRYKWYRSGSGRDDFLEKAWAGQDNAVPTTSRPSEGPTDRTDIPPDDQLKQTLTPLQYHVARENGTEPPFNNEFWDNHAPGIYVDVVSGEPLFSSTDKFDSGTGWPSFTRPLEPENVVEKKDRSLFILRTEVRSKQAGSHLGHVFDDGPEPTGLRYCINSAALRFVPADALEKEGYGDFKGLFDK